MKKISLSNAEFLNLREIYQTELEKAHKRIEHLTAILKKLDSDIGSGLPETVQLERDIKRRGAKPAPKPKMAEDKSTVNETVEISGAKTKSARGRKPKAKVESKVKSARGRKPKLELEVKPKQKRGRKTKPVVEQKVLAKRGRKPKGVSKPIKISTRGKAIKWNDFIINEFNSKRVVALSSDLVKEAIDKLKVKEQDVPRVKQVISGMLSKLVNADKLLRAQRIPGSREKLYGIAEWFDEMGNPLPEFAKK